VSTGKPWAWQSRNCWGWACHVRGELFGRGLPRLAIPGDFSKRWILEAIERHPEGAAWREAPDGPGGLVKVEDGALVLMAHLRFPAHIGVWLQPEARVIRYSEQHGACCESVLATAADALEEADFLLTDLLIRFCQTQSPLRLMAYPDKQKLE
jgi:hypothetical protein